MISTNIAVRSALPLMLCGALAAQTTTDIVCDRDATIYSDINLNANGASGESFAGQLANPGAFRRALMHFDVAGAIPAGATIQSAELIIEVDRIASPSANFVSTAHTLLSDWTEGPAIGGGQGAPAQTGDVTWDDASFGVLSWGTPGGDFISASSGSVAIGSTSMQPPAGMGRFTFTGAGMATDAANWLANPATNFGWIIRGDESPTVIRTAYRFFSRENLGGTLPTLRVVWTMGGTPASATSFGSGCMGASLSATGLPQLGNASFALAVTGGPSNLTPYSALISTSQLPGPLGIFSCFLLVNPTTIIATPQFDASNNRPLPIPTNPGNMGLTLHVQAAALDLVTPGVVTTNGVTLVVGT